MMLLPSRGVTPSIVVVFRRARGETLKLNLSIAGFRSVLEMLSSCSTLT